MSSIRYDKNVFCLIRTRARSTSVTAFSVIASSGRRVDHVNRR